MRILKTLRTHRPTFLADGSIDLYAPTSWQKMTQQQLADKIGKKREYISQIERGNSDMQLSTFLQISNALGLQFAMVVG